MLPNDADERKRVAERFKPQLAYSRNALREYIEVLDDPVELKKEYPAIAIDMIAGLHVRIARKFSQVLDLVESGQADGAEVICRSMFEAFLAMAFICREDVELSRENGGKVDLYGQKLTQHFRATLYYSHTYVRLQKQLDKTATISSLKTHAIEQTANLKPLLDSIEKSVGPEWLKALKANTCAGLSVSDFAYSFGEQIFLWYCTIYAEHSGHVHPGDHERFITRDPETKTPIVHWHDGDEDIARVLLYSTAVVGLATTEIAALLDPKVQRYIDARLFEDTYGELKDVFKECYREPPVS